MIAGVIYNADESCRIHCEPFFGNPKEIRLRRVSVISTITTNNMFRSSMRPLVEIRVQVRPILCYNAQSVIIIIVNLLED